jgi:hypothetical protein
LVDHDRSKGLPQMRKLTSSEMALLHILDDGVSTADLVIMVRDLAELLRGEGQVIRSNVAELAADRLAMLDTRRRSGANDAAIGAGHNFERSIAEQARHQS